MQGLVLSAYPHLDQAAYLLLAIESPEQTRGWVATTLDRITSAFKPAARRQSSPRTGRGCHVNVAFTSSGLVRLCGSIAHFSDPFTEGIHGRQHRMLMLGDVGASAPDRWLWGGTDAATRVDVLLMVFADAEASLDGEVHEVTRNTGMRLVLRQDALRLGTSAGRERFGFRDGLSQPILAGSVDAERFPDSIHLTALGEFVLGYPDASESVAGERDATGRIIPMPAVEECDGFGRNGTYLVLRQLEQDVDGFWSAMDERTCTGGQANPHAARRLAEKIVGRAMDGTPLVPHASAFDNEFVFAEDPYGDGCPLGSHIRRANPRDSFGNDTRPFDAVNDHRILRRGRSYVRRAGTDADAVERGLMFLCLNADIERQFEFIQQNWINNSTFLGLQHERDPLVGSRAELMSGQPGSFTIGSLPAPVCIGGLPQFVRVRGGGYFFLPGLSALKRLAHA